MYQDEQLQSIKSVYNLIKEGMLNEISCELSFPNSNSLNANVICKGASMAHMSDSKPARMALSA